jgi:hypothetical protein
VTRLSDLATSIKDLPEVDTRRVQIRTVKEVGEQASRVLEQVERARRQAPYVDRLLGKGEVLTKGVAEAERQLATDAKKLIPLTSRESFGTEKAITSALEALSRPLQRVTRVISDAWASLGNRISGFQDIAAIASSLGLEQAAKLQSAVKAYEVVTKIPPESEEAMERIKLASERLEASVAASGLSGKVKTLLVGAARQEGDPRLLLESEVMEFLKEHPSLWSKLKIRLG